LASRSFTEEVARGGATGSVTDDVLSMARLDVTPRRAHFSLPLALPRLLLSPQS
jgi:hypothetical protein